MLVGHARNARWIRVHEAYSTKYLYYTRACVIASVGTPVDHWRTACVTSVHRRKVTEYLQRRPEPGVRIKYEVSIRVLVGSDVLSSEASGVWLSWQEL